jgi:hypothetical protein
MATLGDLSGLELGEQDFGTGLHQILDRLGLRVEGLVAPPSASRSSSIAS